MKNTLAVLAVLVALTACTTTRALRVQETAEVQGFMGEAYPLLKPGTEGMAELVYVNDQVEWTNYKGTVLEPIQFWAGSDSKVSPDAQHMLSSYFYSSLRAALEKQNFNLVDMPGPGIMRTQLAITDVTKAVPVLRTVSVIVPQARLLNQAQELVTGSYGFSGSAEVAIKVTDSQTGQLLAAAIDRRGGGGGAQAAAVWQWGDAKNAIDHWTQMFANRLTELRTRVRVREAQ